MEDRTLEGRAYAVLEDDGALTPGRSDEKYEEGAVATTRDLLGTERRGHVWEVPEAGGQPGWLKRAEVVCSVCVAEGQAIRPADCREWFQGCHYLVSADLTGLDTSQVTNMCYMFARCESLRSLDLAGLDTSHVTDMSGMFAGGDFLKNLDLSGWDTSHVTDMHGMFAECNSLTDLDPSGWDTSRVKDMCGMFDECVSLRSLDVSGWNTSRVTNMCGMFEWCESLDTLDLSGWDVSHGTDASYMFYGSRFSEPPALPEGSSLEAEWNAELNRRERDER